MFYKEYNSLTIINIVVPETGGLNNANELSYSSGCSKAKISATELQNQGAARLVSSGRDPLGLF